MTTRELIIKELENLKEDELKIVYEKIKKVTTGKRKTKKTVLLFDELKKIEINGPEDFAENFNQYSSDEKIAG